jgi:hypothetical protein
VTEILFARKTDVDTISDQIADAVAGLNAQYLVLTGEAVLPNERIFTVGSGLSAVDGGAGGLYTRPLGQSNL